MAAQLAAELAFGTTSDSGLAEAAQQTAASPVYGSFATQMHALQAASANAGTSCTSDALATPHLARAWADAIIAYWQFGIRHGSIDAAKPLYLVDLAPDQGQLAWRLLGALRTKLASRQLDCQVCLLACCATAEAADALLAHPYLSDYARHGWLDAAVFDANANTNGSLHLRQQRISLLHIDNPLVILGLGYFQSLPSELIAAHYGKLLHGTQALQPQADAPTVIDLGYQWLPAEADATAATVMAGVTAEVTNHYVTHFHNAAILLPAAAAGILQRLQRMAGGRYLLLAADPGVCDAQAIRLGALMPPTQWDTENTHNNAWLPVNYHALGLIQHQAGAWVWQRQIDDGGIVLHAAWRDDGGRLDEHCFDTITAHLDGAHPSHAAAVRQLIADANNTDGPASLSAASVLALLRQSQYDPALLKLALGGLLRQPPDLNDRARREWHNALARTWDNFIPLQQNNGFFYDIALFAMQIGYWGLAQDCLQLGVEWYGDDAHELYLLAWCEAATGASASALTRVERALALAPDHAPAQELHAQLTDKLGRWQSQAWYLPNLAGDAELSIEPLGQEHAASLLYLYRDEQIGIMTRLPAMCNVEEVQTWMADEAQDAGRRSYAVMHACWGLVGVVSSHCAHAAGYFYFWIGSDFQQCGFGQRAARLLFAQLAATGVSGIYTSVYKQNLHSRHLMGKLGLVWMEIKTLPPDDAHEFYYLGGEADEKKVLVDFLGLCEAIDCPIQMAH
jgi:RimJ/RimL family protein N-acetyltransferase